MHCNNGKFILSLSHDAFMRQQTRPLYIWIMPCLFGAHPLAEPRMTHCKLEESNCSEIRIKIWSSSLLKHIWKCHLQHFTHFVSASVCWWHHKLYHHMYLKRAEYYITLSVGNKEWCTIMYISLVCESVETVTLLIVIVIKNNICRYWYHKSILAMLQTCLIIFIPHFICFNCRYGILNARNF